MEQAERDGLEAVEHRVGDAWSFEDAPAAWDLFSCGTFEDDVAIVREAQAAANPPRAICSIAAGVQEFASEVDDVDGIYGIAQWFPRDGERPELGPADAEFVSAYRELAGAEPDYPAVQAAAGAAIATHCAELAGSVDRAALWAAATRAGDDDAARRVRDRPDVGRAGQAHDGALAVARRRAAARVAPEPRVLLMATSRDA